MKRALIVLSFLLGLTIAQAQYPAPIKPAGDSLSVKTITDWMQAAGEAAPSQSPFNVGLLNQQSHLLVKTPIFNLSDWYGYGLVVAPVPFTTCGAPFVVAHVGGTVAAVSKTVSYGTVTSSLTGSPKCWITQNLGADQQASSATDATEASGGWYWQFNRTQGYKVGEDGVTRTPSSAWNATISETSDWTPANDPCALLLGSGWRIPTNTEWTNANSAGGWYSSYLAAYASVLKLHAAGSLLVSNGTLGYRGAYGDYWSSSQYNATLAWFLSFSSGNSTVMNGIGKTYGFSVRCLNDLATCGGTMVITHTAGSGIAPVTKTVTYGTVATNLTGTNKCWITQNLGADRQATSATDATDSSAGWYWQFNRKQGYSNIANVTSPAWTIASISETSDWLTVNDPCAQLLGSGWRNPTYTEWNTAITTGGWSTGAAAIYASQLKLHEAGYLSAGAMTNRGASGFYWSSTQVNANSVYDPNFNGGGTYMGNGNKAYGFSVRCLKDLPTPFTTCGNSFVVNHAAGVVAPVTKSVTYGTVISGLSGAAKCWITQNLGADHQATAATDATEASSGWYWQFNRMQGFKVADDGVTRTPNTTWITSISDSSNWVSPNDPCALLLGNGWRLPTNAEWTNVMSTSWVTTGSTAAWNSPLKLHDAGFIFEGNSTLTQRGGYGCYWSSTQDGTTTFGYNLHFSTGGYVGSNIRVQGDAIRCLQDIFQDPVTNCGNPFTVTHTANANGAPVSKTVSYGTVITGLSGAAKCWITQNLGADHPATSATDGTEASAGWYWQFNRTQGFKMTDGFTRTPATTWDVTNDATYTGWDPAKDPCTLLLGSGWRLPTLTEWTRANATGGWTSYITTYSSVLMLHTAGYIHGSSGTLVARTGAGVYWSSTQSDASYSYYLNFNNGSSYMANVITKAYGFSARCLKDFAAVPFTCGNAFVVTHAVGLNGAPVTKTVSYGTVTTGLSGASKCWITQNLGADQQATSATDSSDASAGWYWQFNRIQGYKVADDKITRTPSTTWDATNDALYTGWDPVKDPCTLLLGPTWRLPTYAEYLSIINVWGTGGGSTVAWGSVLKLHVAGFLNTGNGALTNRSADGYYWSSTQNSASNGYGIAFFSDNRSGMYQGSKAYGFPLRCLKDLVPVAFTTCGNAFVVTHTLNTNGAPATKTVSYGTAMSNLSGANKCWITQNLGADQQATWVADSTDLSAGWYWQFNRAQGYSNIAKAISPAWTITSISESSDWITANDPCALLLGAGWRIPTYSEWSNALITGGWATGFAAAAYASVLKLHAAGYMDLSAGALQIRGVNGYFWGSSQSGATTSLQPYIASGSSAFANNSKAYGFSIRCLQDPVAVPFTTCGNTFVVTHTAGTVAPVGKTVSYGTVMSSLSGAPKCWITQNLGADNQAISATDSTENAAGWYWQFNRTQGYRMTSDGTRTPSITWIASISESSDWLPANDPCALLLGTGWRIPTYSEYFNADSVSAWSSSTGPYASTLKLNMPGDIIINTGALSGRGTNGYYWSNTQSDANNAFRLRIDGVSCVVNSLGKAWGFSLRCLMDPNPVGFTSCGNNFVVTHTAGVNGAPVTKTVTYGTVATTLTGSNKCWIIQNLGADNPANSANDFREIAAGWYWQFNRTQGFKMADDTITRTPSTGWVTSISENSDWLPANDPCALHLGSSWRIPTYTEWSNATANGGWLTGFSTATYASVLKLHLAGWIDVGGIRMFSSRAVYADYWSSTQKDATNSYDLNISVNYSPVVIHAKNQGFTLRCLKDLPVPFTTCGNNFVVVHTAGTVAPVNKTVTYGTVLSSLSGASKCWITQNLGADHQATSSTDTTEASGGWYWQFNRAQGYKMADDKTTRTPGSAWITPISENSDWLAANDPCALQLGSGWRLPTSSEYQYAVTNTWGIGGGLTAVWNSPLKLHAAGLLGYSNGGASARGVSGSIWGSSQFDASNSIGLGFLSTGSNNSNNNKAYGFSVRCLKESDPVPFTTCGSSFVVTHTTGTVAPVSKTVVYGTVLSNLSGASKCWITQNLGATNQAASATDATEASAGWYWQFNRTQGYKMADDGVTRTPATTWITPISDSSDWLVANDPCALSLGTGWRIPTYTEYQNAITTSWGGAGGLTAVWNSLLKLHAAGYLSPSAGSLVNRNSTGAYWSSTQNGSTNGWYLNCIGSSSAVINNTKTNGLSVRCLQDQAVMPFTTCGNSFIVTHTAGIIAPVTKTVSYGTVSSNLSGASKCWITQNLGADRQATKANDSTEVSAGWYWQFNRPQGYKMADDGVTRTPSTTWLTSISESSDWTTANDPCALLLGAGWRIPTYSEWNTANTTGGWTTGFAPAAYASVLKLHESGYLNLTGGGLLVRGSTGYFWGSSQIDATTGWQISLNSSASALHNNTKAYGFSVRCLQDPATTPFTTCGGAFVVAHTAGTVAPVTKTVSYGTVASSLSGASQCWITQNLGADRQATAVTDTTEASSGWYWQFNRQQGYKMADDKTTLTPAWTITTINESTDWVAASDPCTLLLGTGWRLPTNIEWKNANTTAGWTTDTTGYASVFKLHAGGMLVNTTGAISNRSALGYFWSNAQSDATNGNYLGISSSTASVAALNKASGLPVRCLKDVAPTAFTSCGNTFVVTHTAGNGIAPVTKTVTYGTVTSSLSGTGKCWITQNLGADRQAVAVNDSSEASAGWYWQFNRVQGYKMADDGVTRTPSAAWNVTKDATYSGWDPAKDPCTLLLGAGWRLPTLTEYQNTTILWGSGGGLTAAWNSPLKLHTAGSLDSINGMKCWSSNGRYWSSTQNDANTGWYLYLSPSYSVLTSNTKAIGFSIRCLKDFTPVAFTSCGNAFVITHTTGTVAPVTKTVSYGTVMSSISGANKCWITQNLGADNQAGSATDSTEASAGWYWQFNRMQGYKNDGTTLTPSSWNTAIYTASSDWLAVNDPCTQLLGTGWRIPTNSEWNNAISAGGWSSGGYPSTYASSLKLHAAGSLTYSGTLWGRSISGRFWSSSQSATGIGWYIYIDSSISNTNTIASNLLPYGWSLRCLKDATPVAFTTCGNTFIVAHKAGTVAPVTKTVSYGTVTSSLSGVPKCWITQNLGADNKATSATDATEASAGWYWQFNRSQGYKMADDGFTRTPATSWIRSDNEISDWLPANDPCNQLLGNGWRIPTYTEWSNAFTAGAWTNGTIIYASELKLHLAGYLFVKNGVLYNRDNSAGNNSGYYWSSTQGISPNSWDLKFNISQSFIANDFQSYGFSVRCLKDYPIAFTTCGNPFVVTHTAGIIAPVTKTVTYGTVTTNLSGVNKCWITQNLGADHQSTSATDATEASAGWYWQFNRKQGYKMADDGLTRTPATTWISSINETSDWQYANDPCTLSLGNGWRIPTSTEWSNAITAWGSGGGYTATWSSILKLHAAGILNYGSGVLAGRSSQGNYWSSVQGGNTSSGGDLYTSSSLTAMGGGGYDWKAYGFSVRCLKDSLISFTTCGGPFVVTHTAGTVAPVTKTVTYGTVTSALTGAGKCWITQNLGADHQATTATDATEASAGWYWQFNRTQGYKMADDGFTRTPATSWISSISESSDWLTANDPCTQLLGSGWRIPTYTEWNTANSSGGWSTGYSAAEYASTLKLHGAGFLNNSTGLLQYRSASGASNWSSTQSDASNGWGLNFNSISSGMSSNLKAYGVSVRCLRDFAPVAFTTCGNNFVVTHTSGVNGAPATKTVNYGTVASALGGTGGKCWITQNLGADNQAASATDATDAAAGWYWQFNRIKGYSNIATVTSPSWTITSISETSDWLAANDPCTLQLGTGWRLPSNTEWTNANVNGGWSTGYLAATYASLLKLHAAGYLNCSDGTPGYRSSNGFYWSSSQANATYGWPLSFSSSSSVVGNALKAFGFSVRCLKDLVLTAFTSCGNPFVITHTVGTIAPVTKTVSYGTVMSNLSGVNKCWITQNLGADQQASSATDLADASAGWYWQFNRKQGYSNIATVTSPAWSTTSINETSDWLTANDPCTQLLGSGWRIPTYTEWNTANSNGGWYSSYLSAIYTSPLKLHAAGYLDNAAGLNYNRGNNSTQWSSTQYNTTIGWNLNVTSSYSVMYYTSAKAMGASVRCVQDVPVAFTTCGNYFVVTHTAGTMAPVTKTVTYGTVASTLSGVNKCWITQNLGADHQATSIADSTEASAGWYWQFNRAQGYKNDGTTLSPTWSVTAINETSDWIAANDPCTQLSSNWRLPTATEWNSVNTNGGWASSNFTAAYASVLKLHAAGSLNSSTGVLSTRGIYSNYWSGTQNNTTNGMSLNFINSSNNLNASSKTSGFNVRCISDIYIGTVTAAINGGTTPIGYSTSPGVFTATGGGGSGAYTYLWYKNGTTTGVTSQTYDPGALTASSTIYSVVTSGVYGTATTSTTSITVNPMLTAVISGGTTPVNYNTSPGVFTATAGGGTGAYTYLWYLNGTPTGITTLTYTPGNLTVTSAIYCAITSGVSGTVNTATTTVMVNCNLTAAISGGTTSIYSNTSPGVFTATGGGGSGVFTYLWYLNGVATGITTQTYNPGNLAATSTVYCAITNGTCGTVNTSTTTITVTYWAGCGSALPITHTAATGGAPVTKTVSYGTVASTLGGTGSKCWITQNLGADRQATSATDATEESGGWYWQFNLPQGYKLANDNITFTPAKTLSAWISNNSGSTDWLLANDPCAQQLGTGWRLPTMTEYQNAISNWGGTSAGLTAVWNSALKLHVVGQIDGTNGSISYKGSTGYYWSSTQSGGTYGWSLIFENGASLMYNGYYGTKVSGMNVRCLSDIPPPVISYASPNVFTVGTTIPSLSPTQTGGAPSSATGAIVSTLAGSSSQGSADGTGSGASFYNPTGVVSDGTNLYIADQSNNRIRKVVIATGVVTTFAGNVAGYSDGTGTGANFNGPTGITTDGTNLYVSELNNNSIRKIVIATGVVTKFVGGTAGYVDATGTAAYFNNPNGVVTDGTSIYVADVVNNRIRKIAIATGAVTTFAGSGAAGSANGTGTGASFNAPKGLSMDASNLYVSDFSGNLVRKIVLSTGVVTTLAGSGATGSADGTGTAATFNNPYGLANDGTNLYVSDWTGDLIRKIVIATGVVTTPAGDGNAGLINGTGNATRFNNPAGLATDGTNLYIAEQSSTVIRKMTLPGGYSISPALPAGLSLNIITGVISGTPTVTSAATNYTVTAVNSSGSGTYVVNITVNNIPPPVISYTTPNVYTVGTSITSLSPTQSGGAPSASGGYSINPALPAGLSMNLTTGVISGTPTTAQAATNYTVTATNSGGSGTYVVNITVNNILPPVISYATPNVYTVGTTIPSLSPTVSGGTPYGATAIVTRLVGSGTAGSANGTGSAATFSAPNGVASDGTNLYVADFNNHLIRKVVIATGVVTTFAGNVAGYSDGTGTGAKFNNPNGVATDGTNLYVSEYANNAIRKIVLATGVVTKFAGSGSAGYVDATGTAAYFNSPNGLATDGTNLYVADVVNNRIRKVVIATGAVTTFAGSGTAGTSNGTGTGATFNAPNGLSMDANNLYVAEEYGNVIRKITLSGGVVTTLAGSGVTGSADGTGGAATFNNPYGLANDGTNLYVTDNAGNLIRKIVLATGVVTTIAGSSTAGSTNGTGTAATFNAPQGVATDGMNLYITEANNNDIRSVVLGGYSISPALPAGLSMNTLTGVISGTPTASSAATNYTVTAVNSSGSGSYVINIKVN